MLAAVLLGGALFFGAAVARAEGADVSPWTRRAAEAWLERARASRGRGDTAQAITQYTEAVRVDPTFGAAYLELAEIRSQLGDTQQTEWLLSRAAAIVDTRSKALLLRSRMYSATGRSELALADLVAAVEGEANPEALRELGRFYFQRRAWVAALAAYRRLALALRNGGSADEQREADTTLAALAALAGDADAVQHAMRERGWIRRTLRRHATPTRAAQRGAPAATRGGSAAGRTAGASERKLAP